MYILQIVVCPLIPFLLAIELSVLLRFAVSDCPSNSSLESEGDGGGFFFFFLFLINKKAGLNGSYTNPY